MNKVISPLKIAENLTAFWSPKIVGEVDDAYLKVAKLKGTLTWHAHDEEDEMFLVLRGELIIEMEEETVTLRKGEFFVVPRGVRHNPIANKDEAKKIEKELAKKLRKKGHCVYQA